MALKGSFRALFLYDVADEVRLAELRSGPEARAGERVPRFKHPTPEYVRFERPPVVEPGGRVALETGEALEAWIKYYEYGVVSIELELSFDCDWKALVERSSRWIADPAIEKHAYELAERAVKRAEPALVRPYKKSWVSEDYYIVLLQEVAGPGEPRTTAAELVASHGREIAQIVRGESVPLSEAERQEILQSSISYYPADLLVVGWTAALVYDTAEGAAPTIQLLEYANTQLLEFRHYDNQLTRVLDGVYRSMEKGTGFFSRWRLARQAERLNTIRLDVIELTERMDNAIKFLSDMFYARMYRLVAAKVGGPDYRNLVEQKLKTAGELYQFMMDQFHQARGFALELAVVIILLIDLFFLFRGKGP
jgi:hypothetical protein